VVSGVATALGRLRFELGLSSWDLRGTLAFFMLRAAMKTRTLQLTSTITSAAMVLSGMTGCSSMSPGENAAVFGTISGAAAGAIARSAGMTTGESIATGIAVGAVVAATTYVIAKHRATEKQRKIAEERARRYYGKIAPEKKVAMKKQRKRYIAVDTVKDERTSPKAEKSVMIFDTQTEQIVGNNVYDVQEAPTKGETAKFETYSAEYVGTGS